MLTTVLPLKKVNMTITVKLDAPLEQALRIRCASLVGRTASAVTRDALKSYLVQTSKPAPSAYALGRDLFGKHAGAIDLAADRKAILAQVWDEKRRQPSSKPAPKPAPLGKA